MSDFKALVDIHCHLLPGIDDGAANWEEVLAMARLAVGDGISTIVATPHQLGTYGRNRGEAIRELAREAQALLRKHKVPLSVLPGADVRVEPDMIGKIRSGEVLTLGDRGRYVLLELPHELYLPLERLLADMEAAGLVGVLSHPERNLGILRRPEVVKHLVDRGLLLQVTAGSILGTFGREAKDLAERLLEHGLVHFVATDAHGSKSRRPRLGRAMERLCELVGRCEAEALCCDNPARVAAGRLVEQGPRRAARAGLFSWFRRRRAG